MSTKGTLRTCEKGHKFYKSSDCPICENGKKPKAEFLAKIGAPARRALERENILSLKELSNYTEKEILSMHGVWPSILPKLKQALEEGLTFSNE